MNTIRITDMTLRTGSADYSFREKIEIAGLLAGIGVDTVEVSPLINYKSDVLFLHTIAPMMKESTLCCPVEWNEASIEATWEALKSAPKARLQLSVFTSPVGMEYHTHKKPRVILEQLPTLVSKCKSLCENVEFRAEDATRAEPELLEKLITAAIEAGATVITLCDTAGVQLPQEMGEFVHSLRQRIPALDRVTLAVECSEELGLGTACAVAALQAGAVELRCAVANASVAALTSVAYLLKQKGDAMGLIASVDQTAVAHTAQKISAMAAAKESGSVLRAGIAAEESAEFTLSAEDDRNTVANYIQKLGYVLSDEDLRVVYDSFCRLAAKKPIGARELDAIIATTAMQVIPTYVIKSYLANSGNTISSTAHVVLEKKGVECHGLSVGDGPIDAAFRAIEQVTGHHFELDDFQIRAVTEGHEAMGEAVVKLRADGKLFSGCGVSTDIIGASIHAYVNALNKICHEEAERA